MSSESPMDSFENLVFLDLLDQVDLDERFARKVCVICRDKYIIE